LYSKSKIKEKKEKKRKINNDLAVLPSYDTHVLMQSQTLTDIEPILLVINLIFSYL